MAFGGRLAGAGMAGIGGRGFRAPRSFYFELLLVLGNNFDSRTALTIGDKKIVSSWVAMT
jgi:hypothetical protein